jgi:molybdopterin-containing oxidoreductase family membrane subunit
VAYAFILNIFFLLLEVFTSFYSNIPGHMHTFVYLFSGLEGHGKLVPWMWASVVFAVVALVILIVPGTRRKEDTLIIGCIAVFLSTWIDKGLGLVVGGFIPNPFDRVFEYWPTAPEIFITLGVWATGFFVLTILYKIAISVKEEVGA